MCGLGPCASPAPMLCLPPPAPPSRLTALTEPAGVPRMPKRPDFSFLKPWCGCRDRQVTVKPKLPRVIPEGTTCRSALQSPSPQTIIICG